MARPSLLKCCACSPLPPRHKPLRKWMHTLVAAVPWEPAADSKIVRATGCSCAAATTVAENGGMRSWYHTTRWACWRTLLHTLQETVWLSNTTSDIQLCLLACGPPQNSERWGKRALQFPFPVELTGMLEQFMACRRLLLADASVRTLFVTSTGLPFSGSSFTKYWKDMLARHEAAAIFPPRLLRHIFVVSTGCCLLPAAALSAVALPVACCLLPAATLVANALPAARCCSTGCCCTVCCCTGCCCTACCLLPSAALSAAALPVARCLRSVACCCNTGCCCTACCPLLQHGLLLHSLLLHCLLLHCLLLHCLLPVAALSAAARPVACCLLHAACCCTGCCCIACCPLLQHWLLLHCLLLHCLLPAAALSAAALRVACCLLLQHWLLLHCMLPVAAALAAVALPAA